MEQAYAGQRLADYTSPWYGMSCLVLHNNQQISSWSIMLTVEVGYGMRHATGTELAN